MSDVRHLPLRGRDLPDYNVVPLAALNRPQKAPVRNKARVFKDVTFLGDPTWRWEHRCPWKGSTLSFSYPLSSWRKAYHEALDHVRRCGQ